MKLQSNRSMTPPTWMLLLLWLLGIVSSSLFLSIHTVAVVQATDTYAYDLFLPIL